MRPELTIMIFCLEDHIPTLEIIDEYFRLNSIKNYFLFSNEELFLKHVNENVHIAVVDYYLGGAHTGLDVCKELIKTNPQCFIIVMSAQKDEQVIIDLVNNKLDRYVSKNDPDWLKTLVTFIHEGSEQVNKDLDWYFNLIKRTRQLQSGTD